MISNQVLQNTLEGLREISRTEFCIIDTDGKTLASTYSEFEIQPQDIQAFVESQAASQLVMITSWNTFWSPTEKMKILIW